MTTRPLRLLTWHVHGSYLWYLSHIPHELYLPVKSDGSPGYGGRAGLWPWPERVHDVPAEEVRDLDLDVIVFQSHRNWEHDRFEILSAEQRALPRVVIEHDPPRQRPPTRRTPCRIPTSCSCTSPTSTSSCGTTESGGLGEVQPPDLPALEASYRFFFNPIRYTSLGLAVCEAMMLGMPVVGLATTEMVRSIENGVSGYVDTDVDRLVEHMRRLLADPDEARELGEGARRRALERFSIERFAGDWAATLEAVASGTARDVAEAVLSP